MVLTVLSCFENTHILKDNRHEKIRSVNRVFLDFLILSGLFERLHKRKDIYFVNLYIRCRAERQNPSGGSKIKKPFWLELRPFILTFFNNNKSYC